MDELQRNAAEAENGFLQIVAGPGTGKTVTLVQRTCALLSRGIDPQKIVIMSFTRAAAAEIKERVAKQLNYSDISKQIRVGTFHSIAINMIYQYPSSPKHGYGIIDDSEQLLIIKTLIRQLGWEIATPSFLEHVGKGIASLAKYLQRLISKQQQRCSNEENDLELSNDDFKKFLEQYFQRMEDLKRMDFDGVLVQFYEMLLSPLGNEIKKRFDAVLVDEFQDTSTLQLLTTIEMSSGCKNLSVVGDPDQSIYGFRNANPRNFAIMKEQTNCKQCFLEYNYRSEQPILDAALNVINKSDRFGGKRRLKSTCSRKTPVQYLWASSQSHHDIAQITANNVAHLLKCGVKPQEICILSRTSQPFNIFETAFTFNKIQLNLVGGKSSLKNPNTIAALCFLRICVDPNDSLAIQQSIENTKPKISISSTIDLSLITLSKLRILSATKNKKGIGKYIEVVDSFLRTFKTKLAEKLPAHEFLKAMIKEICQYHGHDDEVLLETVDHFISVSSEDPQFGDPDDTSKEGTIAFVESYVKLFALGPSTKPAQKSEQVTLSTIHSAKGLQWPVVFVIGYNSKIYAANDEELRLLYVAITRAQSMLVVPSDDVGLFNLLNDDKELPQLTTEITTNLNALSECVGRTLKNEPRERESKTTNLGKLELTDGFQFASSLPSTSIPPQRKEPRVHKSPTKPRAPKSPSKAKKSSGKQTPITSFFKYA